MAMSENCRWIVNCLNVIVLSEEEIAWLLPKNISRISAIYVLFSTSWSANKLSWYEKFPKVRRTKEENIHKDRVVWSISKKKHKN